MRLFPGPRSAKKLGFFISVNHIKVLGICLLCLFMLAPITTAASTPNYDAEGVTDSDVYDVDTKMTRAEMKRAEEAKKAEERALKKQAKAEAKAQKKQAKAEKKAAKKAAKEHKAREKSARYQKILSDNGYSYYMDTRSTAWRAFPNKVSERMIDVWLRVVPEVEGEPNDNQSQNNSFPPNYYLQHYYIRPDTSEIMFVSEIQVYGRPSNNVTEPSYDPGKWEKLIPGSLEDDIFEAVLKRMKKGKAAAKSEDRLSIREMVEEYARISL